MKQFFILLAISLAFINQSNAAVRYVNASATGGNNGTTWTDAHTTLQAAIAAASSGDEIWVAAGTYSPAATTSFVMKEGVKVYGGFTSGMVSLSARNWVTNVTTLQGVTGKSVASFSTITSATILDGFTITGGTGTGTTGVASGGGLSLVNASPVLTNLIVSGNTAANGGGINLSGTSAPAISNSTISGNSVTTNGGGIYESTSGAPTFTNVIISGNSSSFGPINFTSGGGGMYITGSGSPVLTGVQILSNTVTTGTGGGIMANSGSGNITINNSIFYNNSAGICGGIYTLTQATTKITNTVFTSNSSTTTNASYHDYGGGAISNNNTLLTVANCTFYNNSHQVVGNDIRILNGPAGSTIKNSVFFRNGETTSTPLLGLNGGATSPTITNSYFPTYNGITPTSATNVVGASATGNPFYGSDPMTLSTLRGPDGLWMTADDGLHLLSSTAAYNGGNNASIPGGITTDITGAARTQNTTVEMGAYEGVWRMFQLPVNLTSFTGTLQSGTAKLQWKTSTEDNFNHFEVEKSSDGRTYSKLSSVLAKGSESSYDYSSTQTEAKAYYRLKIVDNDDKFVYSHVLSLSQTNASVSLQLYPNPATNYITITANENATAKIYDAAGRMVKSQQVQKGINTIYINTLEKGVYICEVNNSKAQFIK